MAYKNEYENNNSGNGSGYKNEYSNNSGGYKNEYNNSGGGYKNEYRNNTYDNNKSKSKNETILTLLLLAAVLGFLAANYFF